MGRSLPMVPWLCLMLVGGSDLGLLHAPSLPRLHLAVSAHAGLVPRAPCRRVLFLRGGDSSSEDFSLSDYEERRPGQSSWDESDEKMQEESSSSTSSRTNVTTTKDQKQPVMEQPVKELPPAQAPTPKEQGTQTVVQDQGEFLWQRRGRQKEKKLDDLMMESSLYESEAKTYENEAIRPDMSNASDVFNINEYAGKSLVTDMRAVKSLDSYQTELLARTKYPGKQRQDAILDDLMIESSSEPQGHPKEREEEEAVEAEGMEPSHAAAPSSESSIQLQRKEGHPQTQEEEYSDDIGGAGIVVRPMYNVLLEEARKKKAKRSRSKHKSEEVVQEDLAIQYFEPIPKGKVRLPDGRLQTYFCPYLESGYSDMLTEEMVEQIVTEKNETSGGRLRCYSISDIARKITDAAVSQGLIASSKSLHYDRFFNTMKKVTEKVFDDAKRIGCLPRAAPLKKLLEAFQAHLYIDGDKFAYGHSKEWAAEFFTDEERQCILDNLLRFAHNASGVRVRGIDAPEDDPTALPCLPADVSMFKHAYEDINYVQEDDELPLLVNQSNYTAALEELMKDAYDLECVGHEEFLDFVFQPEGTSEKVVHQGGGKKTATSKEEGKGKEKGKGEGEGAGEREGEGDLSEDEDFFFDLMDRLGLGNLQKKNYSELKLDKHEKTRQRLAVLYKSAEKQLYQQELEDIEVLQACLKEELDRTDDQDGVKERKEEAARSHEKLEIIKNHIESLELSSYVSESQNSSLDFQSFYDSQEGRHVAGPTWVSRNDLAENFTYINMSDLLDASTEGRLRSRAPSLIYMTGKTHKSILIKKLTSTWHAPCWDMIHGVGSMLYEVCMLRHIPSGITVEFCFNSLGGFRYCNGNDAQPRYVSQDMRLEDDKFISRRAYEEIRRLSGRLPIINTSDFLIPFPVPDAAKLQSRSHRELFEEYLTVQDWRSDMAGEAIKIQHQTSTSPRQGVYLTPMGFLFIGTEGAMIVDERGDLGVSMEEAIGVVAMWNANRLLELNLH